MSLFINTNFVAIDAQKNLTTSQSILATSLQKLSSGIRENSAKDDETSLTMASRLNSDIPNLTVASRESNDSLSISSEAQKSYQASRSRIVDTDFAAETAILTKNQIVNQAGTAMLAQANSLPSTVLKLLQG